MQCSLCRRRSRKGILELCKRPCKYAHRNPDGLQASPLERPQPCQTRVRDSEVRAPILPSLRRKRVAEQRLEIRKRLKLDKQRYSEAAMVVELGTTNAVARHFEVVHALPPLDLHSSHSFLVCGGFAACIRCCGVAGFPSASKLLLPCPGGCPAGSRGPLKRMLRGLLPRPGESWPSGEAFPRRYEPLPAALEPEAQPAVPAPPMPEVPRPSVRGGRRCRLPLTA